MPRTASAGAGRLTHRDPRDSLPACGLGRRRRRSIAPPSRRGRVCWSWPSSRLNLLNGGLPVGGGSGSNGDGNGDPAARSARRPRPNVVVVPDEAAFDGAIVYVKGGDIWIQVDDEATQLTSTGGDSMPSWSPDGQWVYYIRHDAAAWLLAGRAADRPATTSTCPS